MGRYVGVDGCRFGWVAVSEERGKLTYRLLPTMHELLEAYASSEQVLVDIPIGLPWNDCPVRPCDRLARQRLRHPRASSVFPAPCRAASRATDLAEARRLNVAELGRSLSEQAWGICKKIAEVDRLLLKESAERRVVREIHPEICFWALNGRRPMQHAKSTAAGVAERVSVLTLHEPRTERLLAAALSEQMRKHVQADDILDALVGFVTARAVPHGIESLHGEPWRDEQGLPMEMVHIADAPRHPEH